MSSEYSVAIFEDGRTEKIPECWIQGYLKREGRGSFPAETEPEDQEMDDYPLVPETSKSPSDKNKNSEPSLTTIEPKILQYHESIRNTLEDISKRIDANQKAITNLQKGVDRIISLTTGEPEPDVDLTQPAETLTDFLAIEEYIKNKINYDSMVLNLSKIGGKTLESATRKIWNRLCSTQLASTICWTGANGKYCLKKLTLNRLVRDAVLISHPMGKESEIQKATMLWFSHAQDRLRGRNQKPQNCQK